MFARITWSTIPEGQFEAGLAHYRERVLPSLRTLNGFLGAVGLLDRTTGQVVSATYWDTAANLAASEEMGTAARVEMARLSEAKVIDIDRFELALQDRAVPVQEHGFVRTNDLTCEPGQIDAVVALMGEAVPILRGLAGYRALMVGVNRQTGRMLVSSAWNSAAEREASDQAVRDLRRKAADIARASNVRVTLLEGVLAEVSEAAQQSTTAVRANV